MIQSGFYKYVPIDMALMDFALVKLSGSVQLVQYDRQYHRTHQHPRGAE